MNLLGYICKWEWVNSVKAYTKLFLLLYTLTFYTSQNCFGFRLKAKLTNTLIMVIQRTNLKEPMTFGGYLYVFKNNGVRKNKVYK